MREITIKGDTFLQINIPQSLKENIEIAAKENKRSPQDELLKRLLKTLQQRKSLEQIQVPFIKLINEIYNI